MKELLFKVGRPDGHEYKIYADGTTEGFPKGCWVVNLYPSLEAQAIVAAFSHLKGESA